MAKETKWARIGPFDSDEYTRVKHSLYMHAGTITVNCVQVARGQFRADVFYWPDSVSEDALMLLAEEAANATALDG